MQRAKRHDGQSELLRGWGELVFGGAWCCPEQRRGREETRLAQWTGTATSSTASAFGTTIGFGRR